jgi:hypothetical protein
MSASLRAFFAVLLALALDLHCAVGQEIQTDPILFEQSQAADSAFINVTANILSRCVEQQALNFSSTTKGCRKLSALLARPLP